jgi:RND family efflux transporter MFP subunit
MSTSKKKRNIIITIAVVVALVAVTALKLAANKKQLTEQNKVVDRSAIAIPVSVEKAFTGNAESSFSLPATIEAGTEVNITLNASGKLIRLNVETGAHVTKGQVLGSLDNSLREINLQSAQLLADKYEKDYQRMKDLHAGNAATEVEVNNAKYNLDNAKTQVELIRQQIADATVIAPSSGVIVTKNVEEGEFVNAGTVIATIVDIAQLKAVVAVSESDVYRMTEGMTVQVRSDIFPEQAISGKVRFISPKGDENHNYKVEVAVENPAKNQLRAGTFVHVDFDLGAEVTALQIPKIALVEGMKNPYVYTVSGNKAVARKLVLGREIGNNIEVLQGLSAGEEVVVSGQINLAEGSLVEVIK